MPKNAFRSLDLNLLRVFSVLMAEGNVTRAADRLALTQPAVSNALGRLRAALGDALFEKTASGVRPTPRALELWAAIQPPFEALRHAIAPEGFDAATHRGSLTVAMSDYSVERVMPPLAAHLAGHAPQLRIDLAPYSVSNLAQMFEREGVDLAIGAHLDDSNPGSGIRNHALWPIHSSCVMRSGHALSRGRLARAAFLAARHVDIRLPGMHLPIYDTLLAAHGLQRNLVLTLNHYTQALALIERTDLIGVLPVSLLDTWPDAARRFVTRAPPVAMPMRPFGLIWHRRSDGDAAHAWLRAAIVGLLDAIRPPSLAV